MAVFFSLRNTVVSLTDATDRLSSLLWRRIARYILMWFTVGMTMNMAINVMENTNSSIEDRSNWAKIVSKNQLTPIKDIVFTVPKRIKNIYV